MLPRGFCAFCGREAVSCPTIRLYASRVARKAESKYNGKEFPGAPVDQSNRPKIPRKMSQVCSRVTVHFEVVCVHCVELFPAKDFRVLFQFGKPMFGFVSCSDKVEGNSS